MSIPVDAISIGCGLFGGLVATIGAGNASPPSGSSDRAEVLPRRAPASRRWRGPPCGQGGARLTWRDGDDMHAMRRHALLRTRTNARRLRDVLPVLRVRRETAGDRANRGRVVGPFPVGRGPEHSARGEGDRTT